MGGLQVIYLHSPLLPSQQNMYHKTTAQESPNNPPSQLGMYYFKHLY